LARRRSFFLEFSMKIGCATLSLCVWILPALGSIDTAYAEIPVFNCEIEETAVALPVSPLRHLGPRHARPIGTAPQRFIPTRRPAIQAPSQPSQLVCYEVEAPPVPGRQESVPLLPGAAGLPRALRQIAEAAPAPLASGIPAGGFAPLVPASFSPSALTPSGPEGTVAPVAPVTPAGPTGGGGTPPKKKPETPPTVELPQTPPGPPDVSVPPETPPPDTPPVITRPPPGPPVPTGPTTITPIEAPEPSSTLILAGAVAATLACRRLLKL
jgi:hypothetical protein